MHYSMKHDRIKEGDRMHIASINLRINVPVDGLLAWPYRKEKMIRFILDHDFDIIGCQEASFEMADDLYQGLKLYYQMIFQPRDARGEGTPIFYKKKYHPSSISTHWLSQTPDIESTIPGSHFPRIVTTARFNHVLFMNTHLDYASDDVCLKQAHHVIEMMNRIKKEDDDIVLVGDFNMYPESQTIRFVNHHLSSVYGKQEPLTFHGFQDLKEGKPIDYIFTSSNITVQSWYVHHDKPGIYLSDHYPISAILEFKT